MPFRVTRSCCFVCAVHPSLTHCEVRGWFYLLKQRCLGRHFDTLKWVVSLLTQALVNSRLNQRQIGTVSVKSSSLRCCVMGGCAGFISCDEATRLPRVGSAIIECIAIRPASCLGPHVLPVIHFLSPAYDPETLPFAPFLKAPSSAENAAVIAQDITCI